MNLGFSSLGYHSLICCGDGRVFSWGRGDSGQLGHNCSNDELVPKLVASISNVVAVASGTRHSMVLTEDGHVFSWGSGDYGQLGHGNTNNLLVPTQIKSIGKVTAIKCGWNHSMALTASGGVYTWGNGSSGHLGHDTNNNERGPRRVKSLSNVIAIACGDQHTMALTDNGQVFSWGCGASGQLGHGDFIEQRIPKRIKFFSENHINVVALDCGQDFSVALSDMGEVYSWGCSVYGELGHGNNIMKCLPERILSLPYIVGLACGSTHALALADSGCVYSWGCGDQGQLGHPERWNVHSIPLKILSLKDVLAIACGASHSLAITRNGEVYSWGYGSNGQLGHNNNNNISVPTKIIFGLTGKNFHWCTHTNLNIHSTCSLSVMAELLRTGKFSDFQINTQNRIFNLHKAILEVTCPNLINFPEIEISGEIFEHVVRFVYLSQFHGDMCSLNTLIELAAFSKKSKISELKRLCEWTLKGKFSAENISDILIRCSELGLKKLVDWGIWFSVKNKIHKNFIGDMTEEFVDFPEIQEKFVQQLENLTISPPPLVVVIQPKLQRALLKRLFETGVMSDFEIIVHSKPIKVHSCILGITWEYFDKILRKHKEHRTKMPFDTFQKMVKFFYDRSLSDMNLVDCGWVLSMSHYYMLENDMELLAHCQKVIDTSDIDHTNCFDVLKLSIEINNDQLKTRALLEIPPIGDTQYVVSFFLSLHDTQSLAIEQLEASIHQQQTKIIQQQEQITTLGTQVERLMSAVL